MDHLDFVACEKKAKEMSNESLEYSIKDCSIAINAYPEGHKAGYYADERNIYKRELNSRIIEQSKSSAKEKALEIAEAQRNLIAQTIGIGTNLYKNNEDLIAFIKSCK